MAIDPTVREPAASEHRGLASGRKATQEEPPPPANRLPRSKPEPVGVDEMKDAILRMIVDKFGDRPLSWEDATMALSIAAFEIKQAALPGRRVDPRR